MAEFLKLLPPGLALERLLDSLPDRETPWEEVPTLDGLGRVSARAALAPERLPAFDRSTVDGYALRAKDTFGASESLPAYLGLAGEVPMGLAPDFGLGSGQAALIHTGGMLPLGADGVVMVEHTQMARPGEIEVLRAAAPGENVILAGEDVEKGQEVLQAGVRLRPAEIGGLLALGLARVVVACRPKVGILSSGDEVVPPEAAVLPGQVRDINSYTLSALVTEAGGQPLRYGILPDSADALETSLCKALDECGLVVITAGSSASTRDLTAAAIDRMGPPGVLVHGVNVKPGKPTILGVCAGKAVIGLPGNPVSALVVARLFVLPLAEKLTGAAPGQLRPSFLARLTANIPSQAGREDYIPVRLLRDAHGYLAEPIFYKSNLIFSLARADGLARITAAATGLGAGETVEVELL